MNAYVPKVGDKVRATIGESVVVGEVVVIATHELMDIALGDPRDSVVRVFYVDAWQFEQIVSVPTKFGAVIRRAEDGMLFARREHEAGYVWLALDDSNGSTYDELATAGGFTVLFDGVDE